MPSDYIIEEMLGECVMTIGRCRAHVLSWLRDFDGELRTTDQMTITRRVAQN